MPLPPGRPARLLACLALEPGRVVDRDALIVAIWDGSPPASVRNALHVYVSRLRTLLGADTIVTAGNGYRLMLGEDEIDITRFERQVEDAMASIRVGQVHRGLTFLAEALDLYRGPLLAGEDLSDTLSAARRRLAETSDAARESLLSARLQTASPVDAPVLIGQARALVDEAPLRQHRHVLLMQALHAAGRTADALDAFTSARAVLSDRLGIEPSDELLAARARLLGSESVMGFPSSSSAGPTLLPPPIGREQEIESVVALLHERRLVTVVGGCGVGKTRVAEESSLAVAAWFGERVLRVDLRAIDSGTEPDTALAQAVGCPPEDLGHELASCFAADRSLLHLDGCEHLELAGAVTALLRDYPGLSILATSMRPLGAAAEVVVHLRGLDSGTSDTPLSELGGLPGVRLYLQRAREAGSPVTDDQIPDAAALARRLGGLPLALELAAAHPDAARPRLLRDRPLMEVLAAARMDDSGRAQSLIDQARRAVALQDADSQLLLSLLSELPDRVPDALLLDPAIGVLDGQSHLDELARWSMLLRPDSMVPTVSAPEILRELMASRLREPERTALRECVREALARLAGRLLQRPLAVPATAADSDLVRSLRDCALAALGWPQPWAQQQQALTLLLLVDADLTRAQQASVADAMAAVLGSGLEPELAYDLERALLGFALAAGDADRIGTAISALEALLPDVDDLRRATWAVDSVFMSLEQGNLAQAVERADRAWAEVVAAGLQGSALAVRSARARMHAVHLHTADGVTSALRAAALAEALDSTESISAFGEAGEILISAGEHELGSAYTRKAARLALRWNSPHSLVYVLSLADLALEEGRLHESRAIVRALLERVWRRGDDRYLRWCLIRMAQLAQRSGDSKRAATLLGASSTVTPGGAWSSDPDVCELQAVLPADLGGEAFREAFERGASAPRGWVSAILEEPLDLPSTLEPALLAALAGD